jgi:hypothetical protein
MGKIGFFFFKLKKKKKTSLLPSPKPFWQFGQRGESSATTVHGSRGRFLTAATTQQWAASFHAAISKH